MYDLKDDLERTSHQLTQVSGGLVFIIVSGVEITGGQWIISVSGLSTLTIARTLLAVGIVLGIKFAFISWCVSLSEDFTKHEMKINNSPRTTWGIKTRHKKKHRPSRVVRNMQRPHKIRKVGFLYVLPMLLWLISIGLYVSHDFDVGDTTKRPVSLQNLAPAPNGSTK